MDDRFYKERTDLAAVLRWAARENLQEAATSLTGEILQTPPIYSAIKQDGKRLYEHARKGEEVKIKERLVQVSEFEITKVELPSVHFRIVCSKGTYIRSLAHSFGQLLKSGAYLGQLTRTRIGNFNLSQAVEIQEFIDSFSPAISTSFTTFITLRYENCSRHYSRRTVLGGQSR